MILHRLVELSKIADYDRPIIAGFYGLANAFRHSAHAFPTERIEQEEYRDIIGRNKCRRIATYYFSLRACLCKILFRNSTKLRRVFNPNDAVKTVVFPSKDERPSETASVVHEGSTLFEIVRNATHEVEKSAIRNGLIGISIRRKLDPLFRNFRRGLDASFPFPITLRDAMNYVFHAGLLTSVILALPGIIFGQADTVTIHEVDRISQTNRPITHGRVFKRGEISNCPRPYVAGAALPAANYQSDVKSRWDDGSVKFAVVSYQKLGGLTAGGSVTVTFRNDTSCNNTGYLDAAAMSNFDGSAWGAQIVVTPAGGGVGKTADAKSMLNASNPGLNIIGDCRNNYWLKGPVVTAVIVQDCTSASAFDFGWRWDGTTMNTNGGNPYTGNSPYASFHPMFVLYFYPAIKAVQVEYIWEIPWYGRLQDQLADVTLRAGSSNTAVWGKTSARARKLMDLTVHNQSPTINSTSARFTSSDIGLPILIVNSSGNAVGAMITSVTNGTTAKIRPKWAYADVQNATAYINLQIDRSRHRKVYWSGKSPGNIRIGHNFAYLKATMALPNYDPAVNASPDKDYTSHGNSTCCQWSYSIWAATTDRGEAGGTGGVPQDYATNDEGAPLQREELLYLYNMDATSCGTEDSACAKAWQMLTGESGEIDKNLKVNRIPGGGGVWSNLGNVAFHAREGRTAATGRQSNSTNFFYCANFADKNTGGNGTNPVTRTSGCGAGSGIATGKPLSRHAHSDTQLGTVLSAGIASGTWGPSYPGGWGGYPLCDHWLDYAYVPYLLTGSYYFLEEEYFSASQCLMGHNADQYASNGFFGFIHSTEVLREVAWSLQVTGRAGFIAPDDTPEQRYYRAMVNSNLEVLEGTLGQTGTALTPGTTNPRCANYNYETANRWDWGRCTVISRCINTGRSCVQVVAPSSMHQVEVGNPYQNPTLCPKGIPVYYDSTDTNVGSAEQQDWFQWYLVIALSELEEMGYRDAHPMGEHARQKLEEMVMDSTFNPYLIAASASAAKDAAGKTACNQNGPANGNTDPFFTTYARYKQSFSTRARYGNGQTVNMQTIGSFDTQPPYFAYACGDHGYSVVARAAGSFLVHFGTHSKDPNCPGGACTAKDTWEWLSHEVPYFDQKPTHKNGKPASTSCPAYMNETGVQQQIKFALAPRE